LRGENPPRNFLKGGRDLRNAFPRLRPKKKKGFIILCHIPLLKRKPNPTRKREIRRWRSKEEGVGIPIICPVQITPEGGKRGDFPERVN